jgi:predicted RNase H-like nuclease (RuvC/YqgF family)
MAMPCGDRRYAAIAPTRRTPKTARKMKIVEAKYGTKISQLSGEVEALENIMGQLKMREHAIVEKLKDGPCMGKYGPDLREISGQMAKFGRKIDEKRGKIAELERKKSGKMFQLGAKLF